MRKFLTAVLIVVTFATSAFASTHENISSSAITHLTVNYPTAKNVIWTVSDKFEKASFTTGNEKVEVFYDVYGELLGSTKTMAFDKLPKAALDIVTTEYTFPDYQLTDCIEYTDADNNRSFFVSFDSNNEKIILSISASGFVSQM